MTKNINDKEDRRHNNFLSKFSE